MSRQLVAILLAGLISMSTGHAADPNSLGRDYAVSQDGCGLDHGYGCVTPADEDFLSAEALDRMLPGNWLKAWLAALEDFQNNKELTREQRELKHYQMGFAENEQHYIVHFQGLLLPLVENGEINGVSRDSIGRTTRYWVNKQNFAIEKRLYYK